MPAPSTPTPSEFDLSAALEDAEGKALAEAIIARKKYRNIRDRFMQQMMWGEVLTDGHGNVIPRELPDYWASVKEAWDARVEGNLMTHETGWRSRPLDEYADSFLAEMHRYAGVREVARKWLYMDELTRRRARLGLDVPAVLSVRWVCKTPTAPVYAIGTNGWLMEQYQARLTPEMRKHNRRIAEENAAIMDRYADLLGVKPHGTND